MSSLVFVPVDDWEWPEEVVAPRRHAPKCEVCGRFSKNVKMTYIGYPPEPNYLEGDCCRGK